MKRNFTYTEARKLSKDIAKNLEDINLLSGDINKYILEIKQNVDSLITFESLRILNSTPVEQLNRNKEGIRVKLLRDHGIKTIRDVYLTNLSDLERIKGISEEGAWKIKSIAKYIVSSTKNEVKIKLSVDDKNISSSKLVIAIAKYLDYLVFTSDCKDIYNTFNKELTSYLRDISRGTNAFKWFFTSKIGKELTINSYDKLKTLAYGDFGRAVKHVSREYSRITSKDTKEAWSDFTRDNIRFFNVIEQFCPGTLGTDDSLYGLPKDLAEQIQQESLYPDGLSCTLRKYQELGVKYILHQRKVLLGDEMGLGKTIQAIAAMVSLRNLNATRFIVVCPASVIINWCREIKKFSHLDVYKVHGNNKTRVFKQWIQNGGVAVTTFETSSIFNKIRDLKYDMLVVDEAHYVKNPAAKRTINVRYLCECTSRILFMTGTALENKVDEMINLIEMLNPIMALDIADYAYISSAKEFRDMIAPVYYRRKRDDVLTELPELVETQEWCTLTKAEEDIYENAILSKNIAESRQVSWDVDDLKQSSKAERLKEIVEEAEDQGRKVIVYSFFLNTIRSIYQFLGNRCAVPITGSIPPDKRQAIIDEFSNSNTQNVLICQIQAGGTGLNIQSASVVIICEPQFKPSIENQAIARAYRMGQSRNVLVYRLLCEDTIDERVVDILATKTEIFNAFADKSTAVNMNKEIDNLSLNTIINEERERIASKRGIIMDTNRNDFDNVSNKQWYRDLLDLSYDELVQKLKEKHGSAQYDYFSTEACVSKQRKVSRTSEGLYCHHIDEDKFIDLSNVNFAQSAPFKYQKADRLVYCNLLEHLILHAKIIENWRETARPQYITGIGGIGNFICPELNDIYSGVVFQQSWRNAIANEVRDDYESYLMILEYTWSIIKKDNLLLRECPKKKMAINNNGLIDNNIMSLLR